MKFKNIKITELVVNPSNDRHGPMGSEDAAIAWLFANKSKEMRKLAAKIARAGRVFDSPLVVPDGDKYLVRDGNRRVTCLKLIHDPNRAPLDQRVFFKSLHDEVGTTLSQSLSCQVENNLAEVEQIIETRHNGVQDGEGQLPWGTREKAIHANRVSGRSSYAWSQRIEDYLIGQGHNDEALAIKRSTLDRLLSANKHRQRLGISADEQGKLRSSQSQNRTTQLLLKLVNDMKEKRLTLNELLKAESKTAYIDVLASKGLLPDNPNLPLNTNSPREINVKNTSPIAKPTTKSPTPTHRKTLIPRHFNYQFEWSQGQNKIHLAWEQLQYHLDLDKHKFAIAVLLRTLIDLTVQNYQNRNNMNSKGSLVKDLREINQGLLDSQLLDKDTHRDSLRVIEGSTSSNSIESLQRVLHSKSHLPSNDDLTTMWDCLEPLLVASLKSCQAVSSVR